MRKLAFIYSRNWKILPSGNYLMKELELLIRILKSIFVRINKRHSYVLTAVLTIKRNRHRPQQMSISSKLITEIV